MRNPWWRRPARAAKNFRVPKTLDDKLRDLSAKYDAAYQAHRMLAMAIAEFAMAGDRPPELLQDSEREAALELAKVSDELRAAMAELAERTSAQRNSAPRSATQPSDASGVVALRKRRAARH
jgi:hypothetical protein